MRNHRDPKFTQIANSAIDDSRLTIMDVGLLAEYLRHTDGWTVTLDIIHRKHPSQGRRGCGREALGAAFQNLHQLGYIVKVIWRDANGHWSTGVAVYDSPATAEEVSDVMEHEPPEDALDVRCEAPHLNSDLTKKPQVGTETRLTGARLAEARLARVPNKTRRKTSLSSSSHSSARAPERDPEQPLRGHRDEDDDKKSSTAELHPDTDEVINQIPWPRGVAPRGKSLVEIRDAASQAIGAGWTVEGLAQTVSCEVDWERSRRPARVVLYVLRECAENPSGARTPVEESIFSLKAEIEAQGVLVAACGGCDASGWTAEGWHGHGRRGLSSQLWALENPEQAAVNRSLNAKTGRAA